MSYSPQPVTVPLDKLTDDWMAHWDYVLAYFSKRAQVAHLMRESLFGGWFALCHQQGGVIGQQAYGTGSQDEYDHARALPLCKKCAAHGGVILP